MTEHDRTKSRIRRAHLTISGGLIAATAVAYLTTLSLSWSGLPDTMATHFGIDGRADGFMATPVALGFQGLVVVGVPLLLLVTFGLGGWWRGPNARSLSALLSGLATALCTLFITLTVAHVGIEDPRSVTLADSNWLAAAGVGLVVGLLVALVLPRPLPREAPTAASPLPLTATTRASWFGHARMSHVALYLLGGGVLVMAVAALTTRIWWLWLVTLLMALLVPAAANFRLRVDASGVTWRSLLGIPRGHLALEEIEMAGVTDVVAGDFGGFGVRALPGRLGLITRSGPALLVKHGRGEFVATVEDAATAAALIEGLRAGRASRQPQGGELR